MAECWFAGGGRQVKIDRGRLAYPCDVLGTDLPSAGSVADGVSFDERRVAPFAPAQWDWRERSSKAILDALGAKIVLIRGRAEQTHRSCLHSAPLTAPWPLFFGAPGLGGSAFTRYRDRTYTEVVQVIFDAFLAVAAVGGDGAGRASGACGDPFDRGR